MKEKPKVRIFPSSPADVAPEREAAERVVARLGGVYRDHVELELDRWEDHSYHAGAGFQQQIKMMATYDLVVGILWKRIGSELAPGQYIRDDGRAYESGTVFEIETALQAQQQNQRPDVFVFRCDRAFQAASNVAEIVAAEAAQRAKLETWWNGLFRDRDQHFLRGFQTFISPSEFETRFEACLDAWLKEHDLVPRGPVWNVTERGSPYPGLPAYDRDRTVVFFGRSLAIIQARDRLLERANRDDGKGVMFVIGASGSGKSSLVRAGLVSELTRPGAVTDVDLWRVVIVEPAPDTLNLLAARLYEQTVRPGDVPTLPEVGESAINSSDKWASLAKSNPQLAASEISYALKKVAGADQKAHLADRPFTARLLLIFDQLETLLRGEDQRQVITLLRALVDTGQVWVVFTMRSDAYPALSENADLMALKNAGAQFDLPLPGPAEIADIVRGPARMAALQLEEKEGRSLADELVDSIPSADSLPLLQVTLARLFDKREGSLLTLDAFDRMGRVEGAITAYANDVWKLTATEELTSAARAALPALIAKLTTGATRGANRQIAFTSRPADGNAFATTTPRRRLVDRLVDARLLIRAEGGVLRVAHEALLRQWQPAVHAIEAIADQSLRRARLRVLALTAFSFVFLGIAALAAWFGHLSNERESAARTQLLAAQARRFDARHGQARDVELAGALALESLHLSRVRNRRSEADAVETAFWAFTRLPARVLAHGAEVYSLAALGDGRLASGGEDGTIKLWPKEGTGEPVVLTHGAPVYSLAVFGDGRLASGGEDGTIKLWPKDGSDEPVVLTHGAVVFSLAVMRDARLASGGEDGTIKLWPRDGTDEPVILTHGHEVASLVLLPDGRLASGGGGTIKLWPKDGHGEPVVLTHGPYVYSLAVLGDGRLASGGEDGIIKLWPKDGSDQPIVLDHGTGAYVFSLAVLSDGRLASGDADGTIKLWPLDGSSEPVVLAHGGGTGEHVTMTRGTGVASLAVLGDGALISGGEGGTIKLWPKDGTEESVIQTDGGSVYALAVLSDGRLASGSDDGIRIWPKDHTDEPVVLVKGVQVLSLAVLGDGSLVSAGEDGAITLWSKDGNGEPTVLDHGARVFSLAVLDDGRLASGGDDGTIKLWFKDGAGEPVVLNHDTWVFSLAVLDDGRLASGSDNGTIQLWSKNGGDVPVVLTHGSYVYSLALLGDGRLASGAEDGTIKLWAKDGTGKPVVLTHGAPVYSLAVLGDGRLASGGRDGTIKVWPKDGVGEPVVLTHGAPVFSLAVLDDGRLASGGADGTIRWWLIDEEKLVAALCLRAGRNLTREEWEYYIDPHSARQPSCRDRPSNWRTPP